ncbi:unnamed protein product [Parnassius mnemosyne]|uniref:DDE Tnp4 domain-containing protein n=1 Tax=Parnassius mnemosyne TaxID=213953 RepID=A0AAV1M0V9_9NEOP
MARLALPVIILRRNRALQLKQRRNERRMMRYMDKAFSMSDDELRANYRVDKDFIEEIINELKPYMQCPKRRSDISPKYKILVALYFYATGSYQRLVGGTYGTLMSQQSASRAIREVTDALNNHNILGKWIRFPQTRQERDAIKRRFYEKFNIPAVLGCIDGTHISIVRPTENEERFFNRKHFHSRNVLIVCDADLNILSVDASFGGASHDSFIWNQHPVKNHMISLISSGENVYLLGDSGYAQREYMMTPILNADMNSAEEYYNKLHCSARNTVERTIGRLKNRWRCLLGHRVLHYHPNRAGKITIACCVLHNMCNKRYDFMHEELEDNAIQTDDSGNISIPEERLNVTSAAELRRGIEKRTALVQHLFAARIM